MAVRDTIRESSEAKGSAAVTFRLVCASRLRDDSLGSCSVRASSMGEDAYIAGLSARCKPESDGVPRRHWARASPVRTRREPQWTIARST
ncbi:hypothetical protein GCM10008170_33740 [Methylopila capsulata]|uniref:Uncharacterized protein n=1 Tax=Methylopila capsulata TaxID=61654 RepID=A0A9W6IY28_9HYPH|nr:hypothetical protein GCM10008170_33740 [Methylopila capsulata]